MELEQEQTQEQNLEKRLIEEHVLDRIPKLSNVRKLNVPVCSISKYNPNFTFILVIFTSNNILIDYRLNFGRRVHVKCSSL